MKRTILILLLPACIRPDAQSSTATSSNDTTTSSGTSGASSSTTVIGTSTGEAPTDITSFITRPDGGQFECSLWAQDCPPGEKCTAWADNGGSSWNAIRCVPIVSDPDAVGEPCTMTDSHVSGLDSCDVGAMCWNVDPRTLVGTCIALCTGSAGAAVCSSPNARCSQNGNGTLILCLPDCDPLDPGACAAGEGCYPIDDDFTCAPDGSGDEGGPFDACEDLNGCAPGSMCMGAEAVESCSADAIACCTPYCDLNAPSCPGGTSCIPFYNRVPTPPGNDDVGFCGAAR